MAVQQLLSDQDPDPVFTRHGRSDWVLTVEHAARAIPASLGDLGLAKGQIDRHIGWDPGALDLALALAERLDATVIAQRYSRLVIDCNRPWGAPDLVPLASDGVPVPANRTKTGDVQARWDEIHAPFHDAVAAALDGGGKRLLAIHSYDPKRSVDRALRPWPIGLLARTPNPLMKALGAHLSSREQFAPLGINEPYEIEDASDYTIPVHAEPRALPHALVEGRNDYLRDAASVAAMADALASACKMLEPA